MTQDVGILSSSGTTFKGILSGISCTYTPYNSILPVLMIQSLTDGTTVRVPVPIHANTKYFHMLARIYDIVEIQMDPAQTQVVDIAITENTEGIVFPNGNVIMSQSQLIPIVPRECPACGTKLINCLLEGNVEIICLSKSCPAFIVSNIQAFINRLLPDFQYHLNKDKNDPYYLYLLINTVVNMFSIDSVSSFLFLVTNIEGLYDNLVKGKNLNELYDSIKLLKTQLQTLKMSNGLNENRIMEALLFPLSLGNDITSQNSKNIIEQFLSINNNQFVFKETSKILSIL